MSHFIYIPLKNQLVEVWRQLCVDLNHFSRLRDQISHQILKAIEQFYNPSNSRRNGFQNHPLLFPSMVCTWRTEHGSWLCEVPVAPFSTSNWVYTVYVWLSTAMGMEVEQCHIWLLHAQFLRPCLTPHMTGENGSLDMWLFLVHEYSLYFCYEFCCLHIYPVYFHHFASKYAFFSLVNVNVIAGWGSK